MNHKFDERKNFGRGDTMTDVEKLRKILSESSRAVFLERVE